MILRISSFYTGDHRSALDYFVSSLGFTRVAESETSAGHCSALRQSEVQLVVTEGPATRAFLDAHGDGIADIAFSCDDISGTRDAALAAGASLVPAETGRVVVSGFGDTCHTLVASADATSLPAGRDWRDVRPGATRPAARNWIRLLDHVAVCVTSGTLADCADFYVDGLRALPVFQRIHRDRRSGDGLNCRPQPVRRHHLYLARAGHVEETRADRRVPRQERRPRSAAPRVRGRRHHFRRS